jgi:hypothetical protein
MTKAGVAVQQACFTDGVRYCSNFMSWGSAKDGYLDAYSIHEVKPHAMFRPGRRA